MTENTPTPARLTPTRTESEFQAVSRHLTRSIEDAAGLRTMLEAVTAERDALAAILAEASHAYNCAMIDTIESAWPQLCNCYLSKLPADALAARDARVLQEVKQVIFDSLSGPGRARAREMGIPDLIDSHALRIEREARRG